MQIQLNCTPKTDSRGASFTTRAGRRGDSVLNNVQNDVKNSQKNALKPNKNSLKTQLLQNKLCRFHPVLSSLILHSPAKTGFSVGLWCDFYLLDACFIK